MAELPAATIWTIGHSNHSFDVLHSLLGAERIEAVVDVRSFPYSRFVPQFNREELEPSLRDAGFRYLFLGEELGGRPKRAEHYDGDGRALYGPMSEEPAFQAAIDRLAEGAKTYRIALLCSEAQPRNCHRRLLIGKVLAERGIGLRHILPDGSAEVEMEVKLRPTDDQGSLFGDALPWRSTQSVSRRRRLSASSAA